MTLVVLAQTAKVSGVESAEKRLRGCLKVKP